MTAPLNTEALDAGAAALAAAGSLADEALALHRDALALLEQGWTSQSASAASDLLRRQCVEAEELVAALHDATGEFRALRDAAEYGAGPAADQPYSRLTERPPVQFGTPDPALYGGTAAPAPYGSAAAPAPPPAPQPLPVWPSGAALPPLPDVGGALVGLVAQIADAVSSAPVDEADVATEPRTAATEPSTAPVKSEPDNVEPESPAAPPQTALPPPVASPPAAPEPPLLAAERPPDPPPEPPPDPVPDSGVPAPPVAPVPEPPPAEDTNTPDTDTPCEIAAEELPQVGQ